MASWLAAPAFSVLASLPACVARGAREPANVLQFRPCYPQPHFTPPSLVVQTRCDVGTRCIDPDEPHANICYDDVNFIHGTCPDTTTCSYNPNNGVGTCVVRRGLCCLSLRLAGCCVGPQSRGLGLATSAGEPCKASLRVGGSLCGPHGRLTQLGMHGPTTPRVGAHLCLVAYPSAPPPPCTGVLAPHAPCAPHAHLPLPPLCLPGSCKCPMTWLTAPRGSGSTAPAASTPWTSTAAHPWRQVHVF